MLNFKNGFLKPEGYESLKETEHLYLFWKHEFGQWTKRDIVDTQGVIYNCCEQYMMAHKALLFADQQSYQKIMNELDPKVQQQLGRDVKGFKQDTWIENRERIVEEANRLKFTQHQDLKQRLLNTGDKILAEASPYDLIWGIGFAAEDHEALQQDLWKGQNLLGKVLMKLRDDFNEYDEWLNALFKPLVKKIPVLERLPDNVVDIDNSGFGYVTLIKECGFIDDFATYCAGANFGDAPPDYERKELPFNSREIYKNPALIEQSSLENLIAYVGYINYAERMNSGLIASIIERGDFLKIAKRAKLLFESENYKW